MLCPISTKPASILKQLEDAAHFRHVAMSYKVWTEQACNFIFERPYSFNKGHFHWKIVKGHQAQGQDHGNRGHDLHIIPGLLSKVKKKRKFSSRIWIASYNFQKPPSLEIPAATEAMASVGLVVALLQISNFPIDVKILQWKCLFKTKMALPSPRWNSRPEPKMRKSSHQLKRYMPDIMKPPWITANQNSSRNPQISTPV